MTKVIYEIGNKKIYQDRKFLGEYSRGKLIYANAEYGEK